VSTLESTQVTKAAEASPATDVKLLSVDGWNPMDDRLPLLDPADLTSAQAAVYQAIAGGPRAAGPQLFALADSRGRLNGPFNAMLFSPVVGDALQRLGAAVRYGTSLSDRVREMAVLAVATHWDSAFERYAHEAVGRAVGLTEQELSGLRDLATFAPIDPSERAAFDVVRAILHDADLDDDAYAVAVDLLGAQALVELTTLVGYYATLALILKVFRVTTPSD
jgi:4-carboxymuconolactone decarboxylase